MVTRGRSSERKKTIVRRPPVILRPRQLLMSPMPQAALVGHKIMG